MNERKSGYYFVFTDNNEFWTIAWYNANRKCWHLTGTDEDYTDNDFVRINENEITYEG